MTPDQLRARSWWTGADAFVLDEALSIEVFNTQRDRQWFGFRAVGIVDAHAAVAEIVLCDKRVKRVSRLGIGNNIAVHIQHQGIQRNAVSVGRVECNLQLVKWTIWRCR